MDQSAPFVPQMTLYREWLEKKRGLAFSGFSDLHHWSVNNISDFWQSIWDYHDVQSPTPFVHPLADEVMPGAQWFAGAQVNFARQVLRHGPAAQASGQPAIIAENETGDVRSLTWEELNAQVASLALELRRLGVQRGDRVVAYLPHIPETIVAFLATVSIGAIWSLAAPDMGVPAVRDRFRQIEPKLLIAVDGCYYAGKGRDRSETVAELVREIPSIESLILIKTPFATRSLDHDVTFELAVSRRDAQTEAFEPEWLPFDHPLWIVYSSGTTGLPKGLVHGHGGIMLSSLASAKHTDNGASYEPNSMGERFHWYSSTGWVMWNATVQALLGGTTVVIFDGSPSGARENPDWSLLWRFAKRHRVTFMGAGAAFFTACQKAGLSLSEVGKLSVRALGSTGSPLPAATQNWGTEQLVSVGIQDVWWCNLAGGTDICTSFATGNRELAQQAGRMQCRQLGTAVEAWDENGEALIDAVGELVCTRPLPSMPLFLWGDVDGSRYLSAYFDTYPGIWRHGDWISIGADESVAILGRSDATINRAGLRLGASEIYAAVEALPEVADSLVVDVETDVGESSLMLFLTLVNGQTLDGAVQKRIEDSIRDRLSPRFIPDVMACAPDIPRTLSGKKLEVPIKRILKGSDVNQVVDRSVVANPECLDWYMDWAMRAPHTSPRQ